jgi:competence protein ComEC
MLRTATAFLLGHCSVLLWPELPPLEPWVWLVGLAVSLSVSVVSRVLGALLAGVFLAWSAGATGLAADLTPELEGRDITLRGYVVSLPERDDAGVQFDLRVVPRQQFPARVRLNWYEPRALQPGEYWQLRVRMKRRHGFSNPGGFDYEGHLFRSGIGATGYVRAHDDNQRLEEAHGRERLLRLRGYIASRLALACDGNVFTGIVQGLAVGVQQEMSTAQWRVFARTGTTHLMAISGLHIGMVAAVFAWLGGVLICRCPQHWRLMAFHGQAIAGIGAALLYSALAGLSIPTQRTLIMLCVYFMTRAARRTLNVTHALSLAVILVLLLDPFAPLSPGSWLSFLAVGAILIATLGRRALMGRVREFGRVQWAVTVGLLPIVVTAFGTVSLVSPLANAVAIPVFTFVLVPLVLIGTAASMLSVAAGHVLLQIPLWVLQWVWRALSMMTEWPLSSWHVPAIDPWAYALFVIGAFALLLPGIWPLRLAAGVLCLPAVLNSPRPPPMGAARIDVLDVGQGLAAVVRTHGHTLIYDTGPAFRSGRDTAELVLLPFLRHEGVRRADMLMISHSDVDHAGGLRTVLREMPIDQVVHGPSLARQPHSRVCAAGQEWSWDGVRFTVLHPHASESWSDNDSSCVLLVQTRTRSVLLTGDIETAAEARLEASLPQVDVVLVPHHGSRTSSSAGFVAGTRPTHAIVSAGYRNRWGFPKQEIAERWSQAGARVLTTAQTGAIELRLSSREFDSVQLHRERNPRYWSYRP